MSTTTLPVAQEKAPLAPRLPNPCESIGAEPILDHLPAVKSGQAAERLLGILDTLPRVSDEERGDG